MKPDIYCQRCDKRLREDKTVYLVLSCSTTLYYETDAEADATGCNQGAFPFGIACARAQLRETAARRQVEAAR